jgi:hypothetical protein
MGCGVVCGATTLKSTKHHNHSRNALTELIQQLHPNPPLLPQPALHSLASSLTKGEERYVLSVGTTVSSEEECPEAIKEKWKAVVFGLFKNDEAYTNCLGFSSRAEE